MVTARHRDPAVKPLVSLNVECLTVVSIITNGMNINQSGARNIVELESIPR